MIQISESKLIDWISGFGYVFNDVELNYEDEECREIVEAHFKDLRELATAHGIDWVDALRRRGDFKPLLFIKEFPDSNFYSITDEDGNENITQIGEPGVSAESIKEALEDIYDVKVKE